MIHIIDQFSTASTDQSVIQDTDMIRQSLI